jgi:hypothetical protein
MTSSVTSWIEAAMSMSSCVSGDSIFRGGRPNSRSISGLVIVSPWQYRKYRRSIRNEPSSFRSRIFSRMSCAYLGTP